MKDSKKFSLFLLFWFQTETSFIIKSFPRHWDVLTRYTLVFLSDHILKQSALHNSAPKNEATNLQKQSNYVVNFSKFNIQLVSGKRTGLCKHDKIRANNSARVRACALNPHRLGSSSHLIKRNADAKNVKLFTSA